MTAALIAFSLRTNDSLAEPCVSTESLRTYLAARTSPLQNYATVLEERGKSHNIDPRLILAIAGAETQFGTDESHCVVENRHNAWNWFRCASLPPDDPDHCVYENETQFKCLHSAYPTWEAAIAEVTYKLNLFYLNRKKDPLTTIEAIGARFCGSGCEHWVGNVTTIYGAPPPIGLGGDLDDLHYTCIQQSVPACPGNAIQFDGVIDEVQIPNSPSLSFGPTDPMTLELWFNLASHRDTYHLLGKRPGCAAGNWQMGVSAGFLFFGSLNSVSTPFSAVPGTWYHVAGTYDGTVFRLYVNGQLRATQAGSMQNENPEPLRIGQSGTCPNEQRFPGKIDEVRVWNLALSPQLIFSQYNRTVAPSSPGLVGYWNFDEAISDQIVHDVSPLANDGTLGSGPSAGVDDPTRIASDAPTCNVKYFESTGHYYQLIKGLQSTCWTDANAAARAAGGYLASVHSDAENQFILDLMPANASSQSGIFIGGQAPDGQGSNPNNYSWTSGEPWTYSRWSSFEPNYPQESKLEIFYDVSRRGYWNNSENCITGWDIYFVIEYDSDPTFETGPRRYFSTTGHWYQSVPMPPTPLTWLQSMHSSSDMGGYLATITSASENAFIVNQLDLPGIQVWIGGYETDEGVWFWVNNEGMFWNNGPVVGKYSNWQGGYPDNGGGNEAYLQLITLNHPPPHPTYWNDIRVDYPLTGGYVVEYGVDPLAKTVSNVVPDVPEPTATAVPLAPELGGNYPNPFNAGTVISYTLTEPGRVKVEVFNVLGQCVAVLQDEIQVPGAYSLSWDGRDSRGSSLASGVYFYRLSTSTSSQVKKMVVVK